MSIDVGGGSSGPSSAGGLVLGSSAYLISTEELYAPRKTQDGVRPVHHINIAAIVVSALVFLAIIAWANVIEHLFFITFPDDPSKVDINKRYEHTVILFWYAVFWTSFSVLMSALIIKYIL